MGSGKKQRIKGIAAPNQGKISAERSVNYDDEPPVFSLKHVQPGAFCLSELNKDCKAQFAHSMFKRRDLSWRVLKRTDRHGLGLEQISPAAIKAPMPNVLSDGTDLIAFRYHGMRPMVGFRQRDVFYILWFDHNFTLYKHG